MFTHLHLHTEYSLLDGLTRIPAVMDRAKELGQEAIAMTDHGGLYGAIEFYKEARSRGIKPIIGLEAYQSVGSRFDRDAKEKQPYHLTLLARNEKGYKNLMALSTKAHLEGYYYKPRLDDELIEQHGEGIIVLSGCPNSKIHRAIQENRWDDAVATSRWFRERFDDFYVEIQPHDIAEFREPNKKLFDLARELDAPLVATNDSHYTMPDEHNIHDILLCIGTNATVQDQKRMRFTGDTYYLTSEEEMRRAFPEVPEAIENSWKIAEQCDLTLEFGNLHLPQADTPPGKTAMEYLSELSFEGLAQRYPASDEAARKRLEYELYVIEQTGFPDYILVVRDFALHARREGIAMGVRGSAAASIVLYCLGITDIDPLQYRLVFERFLNLERREMPDIDMDFADDRRDEMIRYAMNKYGDDRVAQIITFGTLGAKASIRDTGRALGMTYADVDRVARLVPQVLHMTLDRALQESQELGAIYQADTAVKNLIDTAKRLEGVVRNVSTHAAGVVISKEPLAEYLPLQRPSKGEEGSIAMTQFAMNEVAELGMLKMDFLGLTNLTILVRAVEFIRRNHGVEIDLIALEDGDEKAYAQLAAGDTFGVFQMESAGMRRYVQDLRPVSIAEMAAMVALYRPGPMQHIPTFCDAKHGRAAIRYPHPDLAEILDETFGVIVYQDQVLLIAQKFAGYTLGQADVMRKAMGKKIREKMIAERQRFTEGAKEKGYTEADATRIFDLIEPFAGYAFNKAHAVSYARIAYQTAYLKANYPAEYVAALLTLADGDRVAYAAAECARLGIHVTQPDVNRSQPNFGTETVEGEIGIRFGLGNIKNVGEGVADAIIAEREKGGAFASIEDFCKRVAGLNKRVMESLVKAGSFDSLGDRGTFLANVDRILAMAAREEKLRASGQSTMFDLFGATVDTPLPALELEHVDVPRSEQLSWERELLGVYVSEHPFRAASRSLGTRVSAVLAEVSEEMNGRDVTLAGMVSLTRMLLTKDGRQFCAVTLEDLSGSLEVTVWPDVYEETKELFEIGHIVLCEVKVRSRGDRLNLGVERVMPYQADATSDEWDAMAAEPQVETNEAGVPEPAATAAHPDGGGSLNGNNEWHGSGSRRNGYGNGNGNGNGYRNGNGSGEQATTSRPKVLRLTIRETDAVDDDRQRLQSIIEALRGFPGSDLVRLTVHTTGGSDADMALAPVSATEPLRQVVVGILGEYGSAEIQMV